MSSRIPSQLCTPLDLHSSQTYVQVARQLRRFVPLWIYTALKQASLLFRIMSSFVPLWIYTALKLIFPPLTARLSFVPLWIYTALKHGSNPAAP